MEKLQSEEALAVVECIASLCSVDIAGIEARHATNREISHMYGKGWLPSLQTLSARFISHTVSGLTSLFKTLGIKQTQKKKRDIPSDKSKPPPKKKRGGGAWRAFVHFHCQGNRFSGERISELAEQYHNLSQEEFDFFADVGEKAVEAHREGFLPFAKDRLPHCHNQSEQSNLYAHPQQFPRVGDVTDSGAIIASSAELQPHLQLMYFGEDQFLEGYQKLKKQVNKEAKDLSTDCTQQEENDLQHFSEQTGTSSILEWMKQGQHSEATKIFGQVGSRLPNLFAADWFPSVLSATKAWV